MKNYEETAAEIRRLVTRLMELSFGCEFQFFNRLSSLCPMYCIRANDKEIEYIENWKIKKVKGFIPGDITIIGHPITLEDVLEAITKGFKYCENCNGEGAYLGNSLGVCECNECGGDGHSYGDETFFEDASFEFFTAGCTFADFRNAIIDMWQCGKPYDQQSPEVYEFVAKILFNE